MRVLYTIFLALLLALFVGLGISAFYEGPKVPANLSILDEICDERESCDNETPEMKEARVALDQDMEDFQGQMQVYNRNVSIISLIIAVFMVALSFVVLKNMLILNDGLLLGGVLTLLYSIIRGMGAENEQFRFIIVTVGVIVAVILGYTKFVKLSKKK